MFVACSAVLGLDEPTIVEGAPDARGEPAAEDARPAIADAGPREGGHCTQVRGPCDLVLQDCPRSKNGVEQECVVTGSGNTLTTECIVVQTAPKLAQGASCCAGSENPCKPGLTCVGPPCTQSNGIKAGRCAPYCCKGDDSTCGASQPEGIAGKCDLSLVEGANAVGDVCSYRADCRPFGLQPCRPAEICLVDDADAGAHCLTGTGKKDHERCTFANDCADGLICVGAGDFGLCRTACILPNTTTPFDRTALDGGPGTGGCPEEQRCNLSFKDFPAWYGACSFVDGG